MRTCLLSLLLLAGVASGADSLVLTAGDTRLTIVRETMGIGLEVHGATTAGVHPEGGLLLGDPDHPEEVARLAGESFDAQGHAGAPRAHRVRKNRACDRDFDAQPGRFRGPPARAASRPHASGSRAARLWSRRSRCRRTAGLRYRHHRLQQRQVPLRRWPDPHGVELRHLPETEVRVSGLGSAGQDRPQHRVGMHPGSAARGGRGAFFHLHRLAPRDLPPVSQARNQFGYPVFKPKYEFFGVGWEAFGALAWDTNQQTVKENVDRYLAAGYPLAWMVVGSGFWPHEGDRFHETTSFGLYDKTLYPDPASFIAYFHSKGLKFFQGLRTTFITDGPFSAEEVKDRYFVEQDGQAQVFQFGWPKSPTYFLDWTKPQAVSWYADLVRRWTAFGVDGFKEDVYGFGKYQLGDDKLDPVNQALMRERLYVMGRNNYLGSPADLHRINDFNYDQNQDRGPVNALALAYSGLPLVYPDIVGGTFGERRFNLEVTPRMRTYMMRNAQWASLHSSMSMGQGPWTMGDPQVDQAMLEAARLHDRLQPYLYTQAVRFYLRKASLDHGAAPGRFSRRPPGLRP